MGKLFPKYLDNEAFPVIVTDGPGSAKLLKGRVMSKINKPRFLSLQSVKKLYFPVYECQLNNNLCKS